VTQAGFDVLRRIGGGGMGVVYLARPRGQGDDAPLVALKRMRPGVVDDAVMRARFEREAKVSALVRHPNIVATLDHGVDDDGPYLVLEYVRGHSASRLLAVCLKNDKQLPLAVVLSILADVADGMSCAHEYRHPQLESQGIVHRDLTPDNILVGYDGAARVLDFGVAWLSGVTTLTGTGTIMGKSGFIAPEAYEGQVVDSQGDLFAFGATAFRLLTGVAAFQAPTEAGMMRSVMMNTPPSVSLLRPDVPASVAALVAQCLEKRPEARPPNMRVVANALRSLVGQSPRAEVAALMTEALPEQPISAELVLPEVRRTAAVDVPPPERRSRGWVFAGASMLLLIGGGWWLSAAVVPDEKPLFDAGEVIERSPAPIDSGAFISADAGLTGGELPPLPLPPVPTKPQKPKVASAKATLRIRVKPYADVFLDGRPLGQTPLAPVRLEPGLHSIILVNTELSVRRSYQVQLRSGEQRAFLVDLQQGPPK
jgi:eukaryotic-like serine/threonine-protein kinase